jgi:cation transport regulator ChaB
MTLTMETVPKAVKALPPEAQKVFLAAYNADFGWRCSEGHAEKPAWSAIASRGPEHAPKE